ncbi:hypoxanthine phosphoribosyltransferase [Bacteroidia bacterium]|nr:hypoxanthine phosphoribosyltransferase [Bacteroidia bacterium]
MDTIKVHDKTFRLMLHNAEIERAISDLATKINDDFCGQQTVPLFLSVLNGSFMFAAQLMKHIRFPCEISFVKLASYHGEHSTGNVTELIGLSDILIDRDIIVVEDIVDTGKTYGTLLETLKRYSPKSVKLATLLLKPDVYQKEYTLDYVALRIPNNFIIGYGLDYNGLGRNLGDIYTLIK